MVQHQHIRLLDDLRRLDAVVTQQRIRRDRAVRPPYLPHMGPTGARGSKKGARLAFEELAVRVEGSQCVQRNLASQGEPLAVLVGAEVGKPVVAQGASMRRPRAIH